MRAPPAHPTHWALACFLSIPLAGLPTVQVFAATSGPPVGKVAPPSPEQQAPAADEPEAPKPPRPEAPEPAAEPDKEAEAEVEPPAESEEKPAAEAETRPETDGPPAQVQTQQRRLPPVQRPEMPVETTPIPGERVPETPLPEGDIDLVYVPGFRFILSGHRENYFLSGVSAEQHVVKFQYSAKFDLWPNASRHSAYFGFTQKSLWRLWDFSDSSPFDESNYAPEVFYGFFMKLGDLMPLPGTTTAFLEMARVGFEHESNGERQERSRSWNRIYATTRAGAYFGTDHYLAVSPRVWGPGIGDPDNEDIEEFLGYGTLSVEYGYDPAIRHWYGGGNFGITVWKGWNRDWDRRGIEVSAQWRPGYEGKFVEWWKFTPYLHAQLFHGYGETLLTYNQKTTAFRIGISFEDRVNWVTLPKH